jgi:hypothetical protein
MNDSLLLIAAVFVFLGALCTAAETFRRARRLGGIRASVPILKKSISSYYKSSLTWIARTLLRKRITTPQYLTGRVASVSSVQLHTTITRANMPLTEPDKSEWLVRRIQELSNQVGTLERDSKRDADKRTIQLEQLDADLTSAKLEFSENISKLTSDGFGLEVLAVSLLFIGAVFGLLSFL